MDRFRSIISCFLSLGTFCLVSCSYPLASQDKAGTVKDAVQRGSDYLERQYRGNDFKSADHAVGSAALCGIALLESGVRKDSVALMNIASYVRDQALLQTQTYEIALTAMFLDRLGEAVDRPTVQFMGVRLLAGQGATGGWAYSCGQALPANEERRLRARFGGQTAEEPPMPEDPTSKKPPAKQVDPNKPVPVVTKPKEAIKGENTIAHTGLHPDVEFYLRIVNRSGGINAEAGDGDNSNTQFAVVGLWCARRSGLNVDAALKRTETRFRRSQCSDGGWDYSATGGSSTAPMTCSGLIGLTLGMGINPNVGGTAKLSTPNTPTPVGKAAPRDEVRDKIHDPVVLRGLARLEAYIVQNGETLSENLYFMWGLERVGMALGIDTFGRVDWYRWGSEHLLKSQQADGSWASGSYPGAKPELNTAFALLFLNRTNLTKELTKSLKSKVDLTDSAVAPSLKVAESKSTVPVPVPAAVPVPVPKETKSTPVPVPVGDDAINREADRLCQKLLKASVADRRNVLEELRDTKGSVYTEALIRAAAQGPQSMLGDIREALAQRFKRMTRATLTEMFKDPNKEIRLAAARAAGLKQDAELISALIGVLADSESMVVQSARVSLVSLSGGKDFGPAENASAEDKLKAITAWRARQK